MSYSQGKACCLHGAWGEAPHAKQAQSMQQDIKLDLGRPDWLHALDAMGALVAAMGAKVPQRNEHL